VTGVAVGDHLAGPSQRVTSAGERVEQRDVHGRRRPATDVHLDHFDPVLERLNIAATPRTMIS